MDLVLHSKFVCVTSAGEMLSQVVHSLTGALPRVDAVEVLDLITADEVGLGVEHLCTALLESDVPIDRETQQMISKVGRDQGVPAYWWDDLALL
ncbi:hypothetical protein D5S17_11880 [Pseudonocardiaceae bacterium YIM PH 21723]|nr:hypothetical protein D5S17_11880 [Pseudonocardiaceae bacterium YIM PH 21723]